MQILKVSISLLKLSTAKQWRCVTKQWRRVTKVYLKETFTRKIPEKLFQKFIHFHARFSFRRVAGAAAPGGFEVPPHGQRQSLIVLLNPWPCGTKQDLRIFKPYIYFVFCFVFFYETQNIRSHKHGIRSFKTYKQLQNLPKKVQQTSFHQLIYRKKHTCGYSPSPRVYQCHVTSEHSRCRSTDENSAKR